MARYYSIVPAHIGDTFIAASPQNPLVFELPDDVEPSRSFEPLDGAAQAALKKLDVEKDILKMEGEPPIANERKLSDFAELRSAVPSGLKARIVMDGTTATVVDAVVEGDNENTGKPPPEAPTGSRPLPPPKKSEHDTMAGKHEESKQRPSDKSPVK